MARFRPLHDNILVKPENNSGNFSFSDPSVAAKNGADSSPLVIIPDTIDQPPTVGNVVAVGPGLRLSSGEKTRMDVQVSDRILFGPHCGTSVKLDGEDMLLVRQTDVFAVARSKKQRRPMERDVYTREVIRWARESNETFRPLSVSDDIFSIRSIDPALPIRTPRPPQTEADA